MVRHMIIWTLKDEYSDAEKVEIKKGIKNGLEGLQGKIPGMVSIRVLTEGLPSANADLMLDSLFEDADALKVIQDNIAACGQQTRCQVMRGDSVSSLDALARQGRCFDLIYVDPPYQSGLYETVLQKIAAGNLLAPDGMILLECAKNASLSVENSIFFIYKEKSYGDTRIVYVQYKDTEEDTP